MSFLLRAILRNWTQVRGETFKIFLECLAHHLNFATHQAQIRIFLADEAENETEDGFGDVKGLIVLYEERL